MLIFRHIGLIILGVFGVFHLTICCVVLCGVELLSSSELHLQSQRKSWFVIFTQLLALHSWLVGGGGGSGGSKYLHSTQPWGRQSQLSGNLQWSFVSSDSPLKASCLLSSRAPAWSWSWSSPHLTILLLLLLCSRWRLGRD